ncbi:MAG: MFS transporter [Acidimicrobiales bacterium]
MPPSAPKAAALNTRTTNNSGGTFDALSIRLFPRLWATGLAWGLSRWGVSFVGPFIAHDLTGSARMVQLAGVAMWAPMLFGGIVGGWVSDRFDRRRVIIAQFLIVIPALWVLAWTAFTDQLDVWMIYPVLFITGVGFVVDMTSRRAIVYDVVGSKRIANAMALESTGTSLALAVGALAGGTLIQAAGTGWALVVMGGLQALALGAFLTVPPIERTQQTATGGFGALLEGVKMLRTERGLLSILGVTACVNFFFFSSTPLIQVIGGKFDVGPALLGLLASMLGFGMFLGSFAIAHFQPTARGRVYIGGSFFAMAFMLIFATAPYYALAAAMLLVAASGMGIFGATQGVLVMEVVSDERRGRALGLLSSAIGVLPVGMFALGELAEVLDPSTAVVISVITGAILMSMFLRKHPEVAHLDSGS